MPWAQSKKIFFFKSWSCGLPKNWKWVSLNTILNVISHHLLFCENGHVGIDGTVPLSCHIQKPNPSASCGWAVTPVWPWGGNCLHTSELGTLAWSPGKGRENPAEPAQPLQRINKPSSGNWPRDFPRTAIEAGFPKAVSTSGLSSGLRMLLTSQERLPVTIPGTQHWVLALSKLQWVFVWWAALYQNTCFPHMDTYLLRYR